MTTLPKISRQKSEIHLLGFRDWWKSCPPSKKNSFSPKCSSEHAQRNYGKPAVTLLSRIRKSFPNCKNVEVTFCWTKFFLSKKDSLATEKCYFHNASKNFSPKIYRFAAHIPKTTKKMNFQKGKKFLKFFLCTCRMQLRPACQKFLVKILEIFCWSSGIDEKFISCPNKLFVEMFTEHAQWKFDEPAVTLSARRRNLS